MSGKKIAFFDFDGTITTKDTLLEIIKFQKGKTVFYFGFLLHTPWLIAYKLNWLPNDTGKTKNTYLFFCRDSGAVFFRRNVICLQKIRFPDLIRPGAMQRSTAPVTGF